ncbi:protein LNK1-like isoform X3 [Nicotiana tomentosiformis]|uniref:protein LNK1-like isoform X3 n=1 Tax=Nicotiana tomentosiformis TaxID=4098 RepID=UPI001446EC32|nr:protein LNK1-like isoform X3 [Nicotiana tomentosiformis]
MMLEEDLWADAPDFVLPNTCGKSSLNVGTLHHCFKRKNVDSIDSDFCQNGPILDNKKAAIGENSCSFPLGPISLVDNDLSCFDNNRVDKDTNDLLYYNWSEMGNFEDIDMMFSSCDSTFGLGASNEDGLGWFASSDAIEGSRDRLRSDIQCQNSTSSALKNNGSLEVSRTEEMGSSISDSGIKSQPVCYNRNLWPSQKDELANLSHLSFVNGSSNSECKLVPQKKNNINKKHANHQNQSEGKRKCVFIENGDALRNIDGLSEERRHSTEATGPKGNLISSGIPQQNEAHEHETGYLHSSVSYMSDYSCSDQIVHHPTSSITKSGNNGSMSLSPKDCYAPNHLQCRQSSPDPSFQMGTITTSEKEEEKLLQHSGIKFENSSDPEGISTRIPPELGSSIIAESTSISSGLDEVAEETAGFHQLQHVTEQLDIRTKLCIRDSLYRLARSAEQRHRDANVINDSGDDRDRSQALTFKRTNKIARDLGSCIAQVLMHLVLQAFCEQPVKCVFWHHA